MIKKYIEDHIEVWSEEFQSETSEYAGMIEHEDGEYYKVGDVEDFLLMKIEKLNISDNDVIIITPPNGVSWKEDKCYAYYKLLDEALKNKYSNLTFTFAESVKLEIEGAQV